MGGARMQPALEEIRKYRPECLFLVKSFRRRKKEKKKNRKVRCAMIATITMIAMATARHWYTVLQYSGTRRFECSCVTGPQIPLRPGTRTIDKLGKRGRQSLFSDYHTIRIRF